MKVVDLRLADIAQRLAPRRITMGADQCEGVACHAGLI